LLWAWEGLEKEQSALVANALRQRQTAWVDFMMRFELDVERPDPIGGRGFWPGYGYFEVSSGRKTLQFL
jgi:hypothetical protein